MSEGVHIHGLASRTTSLCAIGLTITSLGGFRDVIDNLLLLAIGKHLGDVADSAVNLLNELIQYFLVLLLQPVDEHCDRDGRDQPDDDREDTGLSPIPLRPLKLRRR